MGIKVLCVTEHVFTRDTFFYALQELERNYLREKKADNAAWIKPRAN